MNKLKKQKINNLLNYQLFLKNNYLKEKKTKLKHILSENQTLYKNQGLNIIELNNFENIFIPSTILDFKIINTTQNLYENQMLFNYNLNYNILYNFNRIIFNYRKKKTNIIKGRIIDGYHKKILISILGIIFFMKPKNLNHLINNKKYFYRNNFKKKKIKYGNFFYTPKNFKIKQIIRRYTLRYLNFKIEKVKNKNIFSRKSYLEKIIKSLQEKNFKKMMILEKKAIFQEKNIKKKKNKKKKNASI